MGLETFTFAVSCLVDDTLKEAISGRRICSRGPAPLLADSEVLTLEVVGEFLGLDQDTALVDHVRRHHAPFFPARSSVHRTTFARQAAKSVAEGAAVAGPAGAGPERPVGQPG